MILLLTKYNNIIFAVVIVIFIFFAYHNVLDNYFLQDDFGNVLLVSRSNFLLSFNPLWWSNPGAYLYRPLKYLIFQLGYQLFGKNPKGYYLIVILIHTINSVLLFYLCQKFINNSFLCFLSTLLFSVLSVYSESVHWISAADTSLPVVFYLSCMILFINFLASRKRTYYILSILCFFVAIFINEISVSLIFFIFLYELLFIRNNENFLKRAFKYLPFLFILFIYLILHWVSYHNTPHPTYSFSLGKQTIIHYSLMILCFLDSLFRPLINIHSKTGMLTKASNPVIFSTITITVLFLLMSYKSRKLRFIFLWFLISYLNFALIKQRFMFESRYTYLTAVPFILLISTLLSYIYNFLGNLSMPKLKLIVIAIFVYLIFVNYFATIIKESPWEYKGKIQKDIITQLKRKYPILKDGGTLYLKNIPEDSKGNTVLAIILEYGFKNKDFILNSQNIPDNSTLDNKYVVFEYKPRLL